MFDSTRFNVTKILLFFLTPKGAADLRKTKKELPIEKKKNGFEIFVFVRFFFFPQSHSFLDTHTHTHTHFTLCA